MKVEKFWEKEDILDSFLPQCVVKNSAHEKIEKETQKTYPSKEMQMLLPPQKDQKRPNWREECTSQSEIENKIIDFSEKLEHT